MLNQRKGSSPETLPAKSFYHLAKQDGILKKPLWICNFRTCNTMGLLMKIRESPTFEYVMQPDFLGSQVPEVAVFRQ